MRSARARAGCFGGEVSTVIARTTIGQAQGTLAVTGAGSEENCSPGTHTYISPWWLKVKHSLSDPNPYKATVEARATLTCV